MVRTFELSLDLPHTGCCSPTQAAECIFTQSRHLHRFTKESLRGQSGQEEQLQQ